MARSEIIGMKELERSIKALGKVPQTVATQAARAGATVALKAARGKAPVETGNLKKGVILKGERRVKLGKKVYDVMMDPAKNDIFVKVSKEGKRSYYPASQEYGFMTADGRYVPGYNYMKDSLTEHVDQIEQATIAKAVKAIDKALRKG